MKNKLHYFSASFFLIACALLLPNIARADDFSMKGPLRVGNQNPLYLQFLTIDPSRAVALPEGEFFVSADNSYSNLLELGRGPSVSYRFDMEILKTDLRANYGLGSNMEAGLNLEFFHFDGGFLDPFIQSYHKFFGFPNGGREHVKNNQFNYFVNKNGSTIYRVPEEAFGVGDLTLNFKHNFIDETDLMPAVAWQFYYKIPTGKPSRGTGSGNIDVGLAAIFEKSFGRWHTFLNAGYFLYGGQKYINDYLHVAGFNYVIGGEVNVSRPVSIIAQISGGTPLLKGTYTKSWDSFPMDLHLGVAGEHSIGGSKRFVWQAAFSEDLNPDGPSVDFTVTGNFGIKFGI